MNVDLLNIFLLRSNYTIMIIFYRGDFDGKIR